MVEQSTLVLISTLKFVDVAFTVLPSWIKGQTLHLLHFFIPGTFLLGILFGGGTLDLINLSLIFGGLL